MVAQLREAIFHKIKTEDEEQILPLVIQVYFALREILKAAWNPEAAAQADLAQWMARLRKDISDARIVGSKKTDLYILLYGKRKI